MGRVAYWQTAVDRTALSTMPGRCNGSAGQVFIFTFAHRVVGDLYKHTGATEWLSRARQLANHAAAHAVANAQRAGALWKGELGVAVLIADLASPENARMPFFE